MVEIKRVSQEGKCLVTVCEKSKIASIQMKNPCCEKFLEPGREKCTGCPYLDERERIIRLIKRMNGG